MNPLEKVMARAELLCKSRTCENCINDNKDCDGCINPLSGFHQHWRGVPGRDYEKEYESKYKAGEK